MCVISFLWNVLLDYPLWQKIPHFLLLIASKRWSSSSHVTISPSRCARILDTCAWDRLIGYGTCLDHVLGRFVILGQHDLGKSNPDQTTSDLSSSKQHRLLPLLLRERGKKPQTPIKFSPVKPSMKQTCNLTTDEVLTLYT